jgi:hypothetical protein
MSTTRGLECGAPATVAAKASTFPFHIIFVANAAKAFRLKKPSIKMFTPTA